MLQGQLPCPLTHQLVKWQSISCKKQLPLFHPQHPVSQQRNYRYGYGIRPLAIPRIWLYAYVVFLFGLYLFLVYVVVLLEINFWFLFGGIFLLRLVNLLFSWVFYWFSFLWLMSSILNWVFILNDLEYRASFTLMWIKAVSIRFWPAPYLDGGADRKRISSISEWANLE